MKRFYTFTEYKLYEVAILFILCVTVSFACTEYYYGSLCEGCSSTTVYLMDHGVYGKDVHTDKDALQELKQKFSEHDIPSNAKGLPILFQNGMYFTGKDAVTQYYNTSQTGNCSIIEAGVVSLAEPVNPSAYVTLPWYFKQLSSHMFFFVGILLIFVGTSFIMPVQQSSYRLMQEYAILAPVLGIAITIPSWNWLFILFFTSARVRMVHDTQAGIHLSYHVYLVGTFILYCDLVHEHEPVFVCNAVTKTARVYNLVTMTVLMMFTYGVHEFIISGKNEEDLIAEQVHLHVGSAILFVGIILLTQSL